MQTPDWIKTVEIAQTLDPTTLPFVGYEHLQALPRAGGVYFVYEFDFLAPNFQTLAYVGKSNNLYIRLATGAHHIKHQLHEPTEIHYLLMANAQERSACEVLCIGRLNPRINKQDNYQRVKL